MSCKIGSYFMFFKYSKNPLLQKTPNTLFLLISNSPSETKRKLQQDFIQNALPKAFELLKPGHLMYLRTHLIDESLIEKLSPRLIPEVEPITEGLTPLVASAQGVAIVAYLLRILWLLEYYPPAQIVGRKWYRLTWEKL
ncbi:MAG: hypothetical protein PHN47_08405 [Clostridia bacterium]|nr:hypothetical protein [Clostridia bacterium]